MISVQKHLEELLSQLEKKYPRGSATCSKSHLKMALYEWNKEKNWNNKNCFIHNHDNKGYIFYSFTSRAPKHCTIRHLFVLEEYRGQGIGKKIIELVKQHMQMRGIKRFRFFVNKPASEFYKKLGFYFLGLSKTGLPFVYCDAKTMKPIWDNKQLKKLATVFAES